MTNQGDQSAAARITANYASTFDGLSGGGLYLTGAGTRADLINTIIENNDANENGAGLVVTDSAELNMRQDNLGCDYADTESCSQIRGNSFGNITSEGAAGYLDQNATVSIAQTEVSFNRSNEVAAFVINNGANLYLEGNLIRDNTGVNQSFSNHLFKLEGAVGQGSQLDFVYNTMVRNEPNHIFTADNLNSTQTLNVFNSVIWDQGNVFNFNGASLAQIDCAVVHESQSLSGNVGAVLTNDPLFVNAAAADFQLSMASDAIDFCSNNLLPNQYKDLNSQNRGEDLAAVNNAFGPYDAGAFENTGDLIFRNGFE